MGGDPMAYYGGVREICVDPTDTAIAIAIAMGGMLLVLGIALLITIIIDKYDNRNRLRRNDRP